MRLLRTLRNYIPFFIRAELLRLKRGFKNSLTQRNLSRKKLAAFPLDAVLVFSHESKIIKDYPQPWYSSQFNKRRNLQIASSKINGLELKPGQFFSFWDLVGRPLAIKGYKKAMVIVQGKMTIASAGGLCQISNLLYWAALNLGFDIIERHRHSFDLFPDTNRVVPFGAGATVFYNYMDLVFVNPNPHTYYFELKPDHDSLRLKILANSLPQSHFEIQEKNHSFFMENGQKYRANEIWRKKYSKDGILENEELICKNKGLVCY